MFKNCVFKVSVNTKKWFKASCVRAIKTIAQTAATLIGADMVTIYSLDWKFIVGCAATAGLLSILTSIAGLPEAEEE